MNVVAVVGESDAGKTTLIERLVPVLSEYGSVGTVKSIHHDVELDEAGKDTHRHRTAGADRTVGVTPSLTASFKPVGKEDNGEDAALERALAEFADIDVVLVEGFRDSPHPKVLVGDDNREFAGDVLVRVPSGEAADVEGLAERILARGEQVAGSRSCEDAADDGDDGDECRR